MKVRTIRGVIRDVAKAWDRQYPDGRTAEKQAISGRLHALDKEKATPADIATIIGNASWTEMKCAECAKDVPLVVIIEERRWLTEGEEPTRTIPVCPSCLRRALRLVEKEKRS
jgi:hypothetical protein